MILAVQMIRTSMAMTDLVLDRRNGRRKTGCDLVARGI
jgi:hypothetical protein